MRAGRKVIFIIITALLVLHFVQSIPPLQVLYASEAPSSWNFYATDTSLDAIWGWPDNVVIAAGRYNTTAGGYKIYQYDGTTWTESVMKMSNGQSVLNYGYISDLWGSSANDVYAVTRGAYISSSYGAYYCGAEMLHYDGSAWQVVQTGTYLNGSYTSIWGTGPSNIYATGLDCGVEPFVSHFDGVNWTEKDLSIVTNYEVSANDIHGNGSGDIYIASDYELLKLINTEWTIEGLVGYNDHQGIWVSSDGQVFAVGGSKIFEHFNGSSWEQMDISPLVTDLTYTLINKVWGRSNDDVYAVGSALLHYNGTSWSRISPPGESPDFYGKGVWGAQTGHMFVAGKQGILISSDIPVTELPIGKERCDAECTIKDPNFEWTGDENFCGCWCKDGYHLELDWQYLLTKPTGSEHEICVANECGQYCRTMEYHEYLGGGDEYHCGCTCVPGADLNDYNVCRPADDLWTFLVGNCGQNTLLTPHDTLPIEVCDCNLDFANCDGESSTGCETNISTDKSNCGYCGRSCNAEQQCYKGSCVSQEYYDAVTTVNAEREQTEWETNRSITDSQELLTDLEKNILQNEFEFLWGTAGNLFEEGQVSSGFFKSVSIYFDFFKKPSDHLDVLAQIDEQLNAGNIDSKQAEMIKNLDAVLKASSVLSGFTGRDAFYQQGVLLDTATDMVVNEALRSAKYSYCRDIISQLLDLENKTPAEEQALNACFARMVSAGVFK